MSKESVVKYRKISKQICHLRKTWMQWMMHLLLNFFFLSLYLFQLVYIFIVFYLNISFGRLHVRILYLQFISHCRYATLPCKRSFIHRLHCFWIINIYYKLKDTFKISKLFRFLQFTIFERRACAFTVFIYKIWD